MGHTRPQRQAVSGVYLCGNCLVDGFNDIKSRLSMAKLELQPEDASRRNNQTYAATQSQ